VSTEVLTKVGGEGPSPLRCAGASGISVPIKLERENETSSGLLHNTGTGEPPVPVIGTLV